MVPFHKITTVPQVTEGFYKYVTIILAFILKNV